MGGRVSLLQGGQAASTGRKPPQVTCIGWQVRRPLSYGTDAAHTVSTW